jgi:streptogramin lyase
MEGRIVIAARICLLAGALLLAIALSAGTATAAPTITEYSTGLAGNAAPLGISAPVGGSLWFTQSEGTPAIDSIGSTGAIASHATGATFNPLQIAAGPEGDLWFTEYGSVALLGLLTLELESSVDSFNPANGTLKLHELPGESEPEGVATGHEGDIWVAETGSKKLGRIVPASGALSEFSLPGGSGEPQEIVAGDEGDLWFTESQPSAIGRFDPVTKAFTTFTSGLTSGSNPRGIALGPEGDLWFTEAVNSGRIGRITPSGTITEFSSGLKQGTPEDIVTASDGNLYFTESNSNGAIASITPAGAITEYTTGLTSKSEPAGIASGPEGNVWFVERASSKVGRLTVPPSATTLSAEAVSPVAERLGASVGTNAQSSEYFFQYGLTSSYESSSTQTSDAAAASPGNVSQTISGLQPGTAYHYRVVASNASGATDGLDLTFTTALEPTASVAAASALSATGATLHGAVNPEGLPTADYFEYGLTAEYGETAPDPQQSAGAGSSSVNVSTALSGLQAGTNYHYRLVATDCGGCLAGTVYSADETFTTTRAPAVEATAAEAVGLNAATIGGTVDSEELTTTYHFEWGPNEAYGSSAPSPEETIGAGAGSQSVTLQLTGLQPGTIYHYRVVASNSSGTSESSDMSFETASPPTATATQASSLTSTDATLNGAVNPGGLPTTYEFEWGPNATYGSSVPSQSAGPEAGDEIVSAQLSELEPGTTYHYRVIASDCGGCEAGTAYSTDATFTTAQQPVEPPSEQLSEPQTSSEASLDPLQTLGESPLELEDPPTGTLFSSPPPAPQIGVRATVQTESGTVGVRNSAGRFVPLGTEGSVPIGTAIDASHGTLEIVTALGDGKVQAAKVWGGVFVVHQSASGSGMTSFTLAGKAPRCGHAAHADAPPKLEDGAVAVSAIASAAKRKTRKRDELWAHDKDGKYSTHGANSVATVLGTTWGTIETCAGTVTSVLHGRVSVRNLHTHRAVVVSAGHHYLARR